MPVWHQQTEALRRSGQLQVVGITQEQHPDRCRLFLQWHRIEWPVMVDSLNLLGVAAVPLVYWIDEHGVLRRKGRVGAIEDLVAFAAAEHAAPEPLPEPATRDFPAISERLRREAAESSHPETWLSWGDALFLEAQSAALGGKRGSTWQKRLGESIDGYRRAIELGARPEARFRLGVALRRRYETPARRPGDFQQAVASWGEALDARPNQYIWRRRIQQYGPRLDKPYSFYDWVNEARKDIRARDERPVEVLVEPTGAEIAYPLKTFPAEDVADEEPDSGARIRRDGSGLVGIEAAVAPAAIRPGKSARIHLTLRPDAKKKAHWNNEAGQVRVWLDPPASLAVGRRLLKAENADTPVSSEPRKIEFEIRVRDDTPPGKLTLQAYALYFVCEDRDGVCFFLRQDIDIPVPVK